jgi:phosphonate transport system substrate-binding protein
MLSEGEIDVMRAGAAGFSRTHALSSLCTGLIGFVALLGTSLAGAQAGGPSAAPAVEYSFGVVPQFEQRKLHAIWKPIVDALERSTGLRFNLVTTLSIREYHEAYERGQFDFGYMNAYNIVSSRESQPYNPLVADEEPVRGIIVVQKDSDIKTVAGLDGKVVAFPSPKALGACLLVRAEFEQVYHIQVAPLYAATHSSVYLHVAKGLAIAGGGVERTLQEQDPAIRAQLRVLTRTRPFPAHPVAAHPRIPKEIQEKVRQALLSMNDTQEGREMLAKIPVTRFVPTHFENYEQMKAWGLEKYELPEQGRN